MVRGQSSSDPSNEKPHASAHQPVPSQQLQKNEWTAFTVNSLANAHVIGKTSDRRLVLAGIRYDRLLAHNRFVHFSFTPELIPLAALFQPVFGGFALSRAFPPVTHRQVSYGLGASPLALELSILPRRKIQPYIGGAGGFLYFSRNVPSRFAAQFNFTMQASAGIKVRLNGESALSIAYIFHHISNGYAARENMGVDSQMISVGYTLAFHRRNSPETAASK